MNHVRRCQSGISRPLIGIDTAGRGVRAPPGSVMESGSTARRVRLLHSVVDGVPILGCGSGSVKRRNAPGVGVSYEAARRWESKVWSRIGRGGLVPTARPRSLRCLPSSRTRRGGGARVDARPVAGAVSESRTRAGHHQGGSAMAALVTEALVVSAARISRWADAVRRAIASRAASSSQARIAVTIARRS
jgi:hypothetical protein